MYAMKKSILVILGVLTAAALGALVVSVSMDKTGVNLRNSGKSVRTGFLGKELPAKPDIRPRWKFDFEKLNYRFAWYCESVTIPGRDAPPFVERTNLTGEATLANLDNRQGEFAFRYTSFIKETGTRTENGEMEIEDTLSWRESKNNETHPPPELREGMVFRITAHGSPSWLDLPGGSGMAVSLDMILTLPAEKISLHETVSRKISGGILRPETVHEGGLETTYMGASEFMGRECVLFSVAINMEKADVSDTGRGEEDPVSARGMIYFDLDAGILVHAELHIESEITSPMTLGGEADSLRVKEEQVVKLTLAAEQESASPR